jgi:excisionase family DNA binding protein
MSTTTHDTALPTLLDLEAVAQLLGVKRRRLYDLIRFHGLPVYRFGTQLRIDPVELRQWLAAHHDAGDR